MRFFKKWPVVRILLGLTVLIPLVLALWLWSIDRDLKARLSQGWFSPPVEFFAAPERLQVGQTVNLNRLKDQLASWGWRVRGPELVMHPQDVKLLSAEQCRAEAADFSWPSVFERCLSYWDPTESGPHWLVESEGKLDAILDSDHTPQESSQLPARRFAQYYQGQPILREVIELGQMPLTCAQAVTAIEDADFLEHRGISPTAIARAMVRNLSKARFAEGGSTITQQLVKNYFLTSEKTLRRKLVEQAMAVLLELRVDKDDILTNYLNEIYMGQDGSFQVRGFGAAAEYYFGKRLSDLDLKECALLAAIINNPGKYNPWRNPEAAAKRRHLVLTRMRDLHMINDEELAQTEKAPLGGRQARALSEPAPYFVQAVWDQINSMGLNFEGGLRVYTTLELQAQERAQTGVLKHLETLESQFPRLKTASPRGPLQGAVLMVDVRTAGVKALVGGRQFKINQFNRIQKSHRQPGSLFKPFVFLTALESGDFAPDSKLSDEPWTYRYEGQTWKPRNYDNKFRGEVTMTEALANSLNVPTARLAVDVGIPSIIELAGRLGIQSQLESVPALALGAAEVTPLEMGQAYLTIARRGEKLEQHLIRRIETREGSVLFEFHDEPQMVTTPEAVAQLITMMQATFVSGSAQAARLWGLPDEPAGKTGTTSDTKDNWFIGFNGENLTLVWIGYDDNSPTGMSGASAALPLWYRVHYRAH